MSCDTGCGGGLHSFNCHDRQEEARLVARPPRPGSIIEADCVYCADGKTGFFNQQHRCPKCKRTWGEITATSPKDPLSVPPISGSIQDTLAERGKRYGDFAGHADITQRLKAIMSHDEKRWWGKLNDSQREALEMIAHKIGRILNGDPNYLDSWHDIVGYAQLVCNQLQEKK